MAVSSGLQLTLPLFEGEIDELLRLVSEQRLAADAVPMTELVGQVVGYIRAGDTLEIEEAGHAIAIASRLLQLKSARLLAQPVVREEEDEPQIDAEALLNRDIMRETALRFREWEGRETIAPLASPVSIEQRVAPQHPSILADAWTQLVRRAPKEATRLAVPAFVRLEVAVSTLLRRLRSSVRVSLKSLLHGATRNDAVVHFLAVIELTRRREVTVSQPELFADITVEYVERASDTSARAG